MKYFFLPFVLFNLLFTSVYSPAAAEDIDDAYVHKILDANDATALQLLIDAGLDVNSRDANGDTMLFYVLIHQADFTLAKILLDAGADANLPSSNGMTPILIATATAAEIENNQAQTDTTIDGVQKEIEQAQLTEQKNFLLQRAGELLKFLIQNGADVNQETPRGTPLMNAATSDLNAPLIPILLEAGAKVNLQDRYGRTALFYAAAFDCDSIETLLLKAGADIRIADQNGRSYLEASKEEIMETY